jgi:hypothetical protein
MLIAPDVDSNSPAFWQFVGGRNILHVITSMPSPRISRGPTLGRLSELMPVRFSNQISGGRWIEAVLQADDGMLYGYYHNEPSGLCPGAKTAPRIGAARSFDNGFSWQDLGIILEVPAARLLCSTPNLYFAGGVGDFSVMLDQNKTDVYFFISVYTGGPSRQGVAVGRMLWSQRDTPQGNVSLWDGNVWKYAASGTRLIRRNSFEPAPIYPAAISWHDGSTFFDSFWGPSVHWNTFLNQYVMLLNRAADSKWTQEGIYIAFSPVLDDPGQWTQPEKVMDGGAWYPQVMGINRGTDKLAGATARFFMGGRSDYLLVFRK